MMSKRMGRQLRPWGIVIVAALMILFGLAEVVTAFTHHFLGISTSDAMLFTSSAAAIGALYVASGLLILSMKKWAAALAIVLLIADIMGRIALVVAGLYPLTSLEQDAGIAIGTAVAAVFAFYIGSKWSTYS